MTGWIICCAIRLMTGAKYGIYDVEWIIKSLEIDEENDRLYVSARGIFAVEDYLQARYYMFRQVYFHRTLRSAETVLRSLLRRALELFQNGKYVWFATETPFEKILKGERLSIKRASRIGRCGRNVSHQTMAEIGR